MSNDHTDGKKITTSSCQIVHYSNDLRETSNKDIHTDDDYKMKEAAERQRQIKPTERKYLVFKK